MKTRSVKLKERVRCSKLCFTRPGYYRQALAYFQEHHSWFCMIHTLAVRHFTDHSVSRFTRSVTSSACCERLRKKLGNKELSQKSQGFYLKISGFYETGAFSHYALGSSGLWPERDISRWEESAARVKSVMEHAIKKKNGGRIGPKKRDLTEIET